MGTELLRDVQMVWPEGETGLWYSEILACLSTSLPATYEGWTDFELAKAIREQGVRTRQIWRAVDGRGANRRGVRFHDLKLVLTSSTSYGRQVVYFVERHGFVKIGTTRNLPARVASLNRGESAIDGMTVAPVHLLATMTGGPPVERSIHDLFAALRYGGEWFIHDEPLAGFIRSVAAANRA